MGTPRSLGQPRPLARAAGTRGGTSGRDTGLHMQKQEQTYWCWAAVVEAVERLFKGGDARAQCRIVSENLPAVPPAGCCGTRKGGPCDHSYRLDYALSRAGLYGSSDGVLGFDRLQVEIDQRRPIGIQVEWRDGGGTHYVAATNWIVRNDGTEVVRIADPIGPNFEEVPLAVLINSYGAKRGRWIASFLTSRGGTAPLRELPRRIRKGD